MNLQLPQESHKPAGLNRTPYSKCRPLGSGVATMTGTTDLRATATGSCINNRGTEHGALGLHTRSLSRNLEKALPEVGVEYVPDRGLHQAFPADLHYTLGFVVVTCLCK
ncbi:hypothetical protein ILYODFUR_028079 [Ilyodon furcidens]|uniref:Uncharacterized protein n=1 Tax=Ilyodon furcidens TaxID=33524 RepID=A0ABV0ULH0_9TELE